MNIFEFAVKNKVRFAHKGLLSVEDLYDLSVVELDNIFKNLSKEKKNAQSEESLLGNKTKEDALLTVKIDIIKHIVEEKLVAEQSKLEEKEKKEKKQRILEILESKQEQSLLNKSEDELRELLKDLN